MAENDQSAERKRATDLILESGARRKLIVAGPGTGKSFTFRLLLADNGGPNLAITFINALASDLAAVLGDSADAYTFHGFCRSLLHRLGVGGVSNGVDYYPSLLVVQADDLSRLDSEVVSNRDIERDFHYLDTASGRIDSALRSGNYYDAVGHIDSVYRVLKYLQANPDAIPHYAQVVVDEYQDFSLLEV
ncbi:MAG TPA: AAA family ATPase [Candidatus Dormibacteraeota bacterium]|nr:AAA family ATPase [Candidatus Dormibacteraeota bacterium]